MIEISVSEQNLQMGSVCSIYAARHHSGDVSINRKEAVTLAFLLLLLHPKPIQGTRDSAKD